MTNYFFEEPAIDMTMIKDNKFIKKIEEAEQKQILETSIKKLSGINDWNANTLQDTLNELLAETGRKPAELFSLLRIAVSFAPFSPALNLTFEVIGKEKTINRLVKVAEQM